MLINALQWSYYTYTNIYAVTDDFYDVWDYMGARLLSAATSVGEGQKHNITKYFMIDCMKNMHFTKLMRIVTNN